MHDRRMRIYLEDHLALMFAEVALAKRCRGSNRDTPFGEFLSKLVVEVDAQRSIAKDVLRRFGGTESTAKKTATWFAEKLGRLKLNDSLVTYSPPWSQIEATGFGASPFRGHER